MASLPPQASSQRGRSSPQRQSESSTSQAQGTHSNQPEGDARSRSQQADSSQTVLLNGLRNVTSEAAALEAKEQQQQQNSKNSKASSVGEPRRCWICLNHETDDTEATSEWRSPCPCALTAHEACLLEWFQELQASHFRERKRGPVQVLCPQCKSEIVVERPKSLVVDLVKAVERVAHLMILPGAISVLGGCVVTGCFMYGVNTVYVVFGEEDATRILGSETQRPTQGGPLDSASDFWILFRNLTPFAAFHGWSWRLGLGLPLIPPLLVLSRTHLADHALPIIPIAYFASQTSELNNLEMVEWQTRPVLSLVLLPYIRGAYNGLYEYFFGERERQWIREVLPHHEDDTEHQVEVNEAEGDQADEAENGDNQELFMEFNLEVDVDEEAPDEAEARGRPGLNEGEGNPVEAEQGEQPLPRPQEEPDAGNEAAEEAARAAAAEIVAQQQLQHPAQRAGNLIISTSHLADTVMGALLFPAISAAMGGLLKLSLPRSWTSRLASNGKSSVGISSILQARWGRSLVGGCLFVVLKDALVLYYRWRRAQSNRYMRVLDYHRAKGAAGLGRRGAAEQGAQSEAGR
ncbi:MAG: hypothetical protein M4579_000623 [Chaenotheca gracillima]|nr:MAG: hypothetical protein M4579_000623 [Chaenotheca gracillima]